VGQPRRLHAQVRPSSTADGVSVVPRAGTSVPSLARVLASALGAKPRREFGSLGVNGLPLARLLSLQTPELELEWTPEAQTLARNRARATAALPAMRTTLAELGTGGAELARTMLADLQGLDVLDDHQLVNVAAMASPDCFGLCVFDEQGTGKTVTVLYAFDALVARNLADVLLILAPKSMLPEWKRDFERFHSDLYRVALVVGTRRGRPEARGAQGGV
jgi:hypothetical protein